MRWTSRDNAMLHSSEWRFIQMTTGDALEAKILLSVKLLKIKPFQNVSSRLLAAKFKYRHKRAGSDLYARAVGAFWQAYAMISEIYGTASCLLERVSQKSSSKIDETKKRKVLQNQRPFCPPTLFQTHILPLSRSNIC